jgi:hypothetical protein
MSASIRVLAAVSMANLGRRPAKSLDKSRSVETQTMFRDTAGTRLYRIEKSGEEDIIAPTGARVYELIHSQFD